MRVVERDGDARGDARLGEVRESAGGRRSDGGARGDVRVSEVHVRRASAVRGVVGMERAGGDGAGVGAGFEVRPKRGATERTRGDERRRATAADVRVGILHHDEVLLHQLNRVLSRRSVGRDEFRVVVHE